MTRARRNKPYHLRYHGDALGGYELLTLEERGAYTTLLDQMYDHGGPIRDDVRNACAWLNCDVRVWKRLRIALVDTHRKLLSYTDAQGRAWLVNNRVQAELKLPTYAELTANLAPKLAIANEQLSAKSSKKGSENNASGEPKEPENSPLIPIPIPISPIVPSGDGSDKVAGEQPDEVRKAFDLWNALATQCGLPVARDLTEARRRGLRKRLAGQGITGWTEALSLVARSQFCRGLIKPKSPDDQPFRADLDFVLQPKSFQRLLEGYYNRGPDAPLPIAAGAAAQPLSDADRWRRHLEVFRLNFHWPDELGPRPGREGCRAPLDLLGEFGFVHGVVPLNPLFPPTTEAKEPAHACR